MTFNNPHDAVAYATSHKFVGEDGHQLIYGDNGIVCVTYREDTEMQQADIDYCEELKRKLNALGMYLVDYLIVGSASYYTFAYEQLKPINE